MKRNKNAMLSSSNSLLSPPIHLNLENVKKNVESRKPNGTDVEEQCDEILTRVLT